MAKYSIPENAVNNWETFRSLALEGLQAQASRVQLALQEFTNHLANPVAEELIAKDEVKPIEELPVSEEEVIDKKNKEKK